MIIKISDLRDPVQISMVGDMDVDYVGFNFCDNDERFFAQKSNALTSTLPRKIKRVGVFYSDLELYIISVAGQVGLNSVQVDGDQNPQFCEIIAAEGLEVIKTFTPQNIETIDRFEGVCNKFILRGFDAQSIAKIDTKTPFLVEGDWDLLSDVVGMNNLPSSFVGVDTGRFFETATAVKDMDLVQKLIELKR